MKKILYIEDDKAIADIFKKRFTKEGYSVEICDNGEDGLKAVLDFMPDLVITGILMPKVSGFDVIDILKQTDETKHIPIVVLSALSRQEDKDRAKKLGAIDYMVMSQVVISDVVTRINKIMDDFYSDPIKDTSIKYSVVQPLLMDKSNEFELPSADLLENISSENDNKLFSLANFLNSIKNRQSESKSSFIVGKSHSDKIKNCNLDDSNHVLISGQTGSGKSLFFDNILINLLLKNTPNDLRLVIIDPKYVQFQPYKDIPHLITPVINTPEHAKSAMEWVASEIDRRYNFLSMHGCRNAHSFNEKNTEEVLPNILVLCDEIADLMMVDGEFYDNAFFKIVEKGRAVGMHLIISTSRPSRDIITDTMIQSIQYRIGFAAASEVDSQRIIGQSGAEQLHGKGDLLLRETESSSLLRLQAPYLSDDDVASVTDFLRSQSTVKYIDVDAKVKSYSDVADGDLYEDAKSYVIEQQKAGTAMLQMKFQIGYGRAARIIEKLEEDEIIGPADGASPRKVYVNSPE